MVGYTYNDFMSLNDGHVYGSVKKVNVSGTDITYMSPSVGKFTDIFPDWEEKLNYGQVVDDDKLSDMLEEFLELYYTHFARSFIVTIGTVRGMDARIIDGFHSLHTFARTFSHIRLNIRLIDFESESDRLHSRYSHLPNLNDMVNRNDL